VSFNGRQWAKLLHHGLTAEATVVRLPWEKLNKTAHTSAYKRFFSVFNRFLGIRMFTRGRIWK